MKRDITELETVLEQEIEDSINNSFGIEIKSDKDLKEKMSEIKLGLASTDWEKRIENLQKLRGVMKNVRNKPEEFLKLIKTFDSQFKKTLADLRSQVVREACLTVGYLSVELGGKFELSVISMLDELMNLVTNGVKIMSLSGKMALKTIVLHIQSQRIFHKIVYIFNQTRSTQVRQFCCELLATICEKWPVKIIEKLSKEFCQIVGKGICDADEQARAFSRSSYGFLQSKFPKLAETIFKNLDSSKQKSLSNQAAFLKPTNKHLHNKPVNKEIPIKRSETILKVAKPVVRFGSFQGSPMKRVFDSKTESVNSSTSTLNSDFVPVINKEETNFMNIIKSLKSDSHLERLEGLNKTETFLNNSTFKSDELPIFTNVLETLFLDNQTKVILKFLSVLIMFIDAYHSQLSDWLAHLFLHLINFQGNSNLKTISEITENILNLILTRLGSKFVFLECCRILTNKTDQISTKAQIVILESLKKSITEISNFIYEIEAINFSGAVDKILLWSDNTRSQELRNNSTSVISKIFSTHLKLLEHLLGLLSQSSRIKVLYIIDPNMSTSCTLKTQPNSDIPMKYTPTKRYSLKPQGKICNSPLLKEKNFHLEAESIFSENVTKKLEIISRSELPMSDSNEKELDGFLSCIEENTETETIVINQLTNVQDILGRFSSQYLEEKTTQYSSLFLKLTGHQSSRVRKHSVLCLGKMCTIIGERMFQILNLPQTTVKLVKIYTKYGKL